jgi:DNA-binding XRE family transcriptional regulator
MIPLSPNDRLTGLRASGPVTKRRRSDDDSSERPRGGLGWRGSHAGETTLQRDGRRIGAVPAVRAVLGSMVQKRKQPARIRQSRLAELRSERQAEAADPSAWTQIGLARKVGASVRSVKAWEAGATLPRLYYRRRLAKAFGVGIAELGFRSLDPSDR